MKFILDCIRSTPFVLAALLSVSSAARLHGQSAVIVDTIAEARRLRDASDYAAAATLMRSYVDAHPDDAGSARFAALMAYWAKDFPAADSAYARALARHTIDASLRLEYGRFLIETGSPARARDVLSPLLAADSTPEGPAQIARARTLLGTADYWAGNLVGARRQFQAALRLDTSVTDARRQLAEIASATAPWVRVGSEVWDDDQPLRHATFDVESGWFANPVTPLVIRAGWTVFDREAITETVSALEAGVTTYAAAAHLDMAVAGGVLQRSFDKANDWTARGSLGARLPHRVTLQAKAERAPYTRTVRSLATSIMVSSIDGGMRWGSPRGWLGEILARRERYPDDNSVSTAYGWVLAPVIRGGAATLQVGYGFAAQSAEENRFSARGDISVPPGQAPATVPGEYNPYYTPKNLRAHSALVGASLHPQSRWTLRADARYAVSAHDEAPVLVALASPPNVTVTRDFYDRSFSPWNARASLDVAATESVRIGVAAEHGRSAYYSFTTARIGLTYAFVAAARRRADVH